MMLVQFSTGLLPLLFMSSAWAFPGFLDDAEILPKGQIRGFGALQVVPNKGKERGGVNLLSQVETSLSEETSARAILGFGETDFQLGGAFKWVPIPDIDNQPGIGLRTSLHWAMQNGSGRVSAFLTPFLSKRFSSDEMGSVTPYAGLSFGLSTFQDRGDLPTILILGTDFAPSDPGQLDGWRLGIELNLGFVDSRDSVLFFGSYSFSDDFVKL